MCLSFTFQSLFGRKADKLEHANDEERTYYIIEKKPLVNKFISVPKDKGSLNCSVFTAGAIEGVCNGCGFVSNCIQNLTWLKYIKNRHTNALSLTKFDKIWAVSFSNNLPVGSFNVKKRASQ
jgi:hypothetical protein